MKGIEICFFRHGIALDREDPGVTSDAARPLTDEGMRKTRAAAEGLKRMDAGFDRILTSPWLRASQTAAILSEVLSLAAPEEMAELAGDRNPPELLEALGHPWQADAAGRARTAAKRHRGAYPWRRVDS